MKTFISYLSLLCLVLIVSCSKNVEPINYGEDGCEYCSMTIVDDSHSAQLVTQKGRNYKFDSSECMILYLEEHHNEEEMLHILSADFTNPGEMTDALEATFLISEQIPSPMGAFLSVIKDSEKAKELQNENDGELYDWTTIKNEISKQTKHRAPN